MWEEGEELQAVTCDNEGCGGMRAHSRVGDVWQWIGNMRTIGIRESELDLGRDWSVCPLLLFAKCLDSELHFSDPARQPMIEVLGK